MAPFQTLLAEDTVPWSTIIWATVLVFFLVVFREQIAGLLDRIAHLNVKVDKSGLEISFDAERAIRELTQAAKAKSSSPQIAQQATTDAIALTVKKSAPQKQAKLFSSATVLWVDDTPDNNVYERRAFEAIGLSFLLARSTDEALNILKGRRFAAIISDMARPPDMRAGYTLLDALRTSGDLTPFIIYAGSAAPEYRREIGQHGGQGYTNDPVELFKMVTTEIVQSSDA
jgi:CheY-like chemotaxis protein